MSVVSDFYSGTVSAGEVVRRLRDLSVVELDQDYSLIVSCDSDGGIGGKKDDVVRVEPWIVGYFGARVPMMEILAVGGKPILLINTLAVEMEPSGKEIISGIRRLCREAGFPDLPLNGSTEENVPTRQTGIGVTILAFTVNDGFPPGSSQPGDVVAVAGVPKSGPTYDVRPNDPEILSLKALAALRHTSKVRDILPVGSRGIACESRELARSAGLKFHEAPNDADLNRSAGPSTCVVFSAANEDCISAVHRKITAPVQVIGSLKRE